MEKKLMSAINSSTIRGIVNAANKEGILREDIVSLTKERDQYVLVYYK